MRRHRSVHAGVVDGSPILLDAQQRYGCADRRYCAAGRYRLAFNSATGTDVVPDRTNGQCRIDNEGGYRVDEVA